MTPIAPDITDPERVARVAERWADVSLLVNNAEARAASTFINAPGQAAARLEMETSYFGMLSRCRAFAPVLGGGAVVNMLSAGSFYTDPLARCLLGAGLMPEACPPVQAFWAAALRGTS